MKKHILLITVFAFAILSCQSQDNNGNLFFVSAGPSVPIGGFSKKDLENNNAGFAKTGEAINLLFLHKISKKFSITADLYGQRNAVSVKSLGQQFSTAKFYNGQFYATYGPGVPPPPVITPSEVIRFPDWKFDKKSWLCAGILIGGSSEFLINKTNNQLSFILRALAGITYVSSPGINGTGINDSITGFVNQSKSAGFGFSYKFSGCFKYAIDKKNCLLFTLDYLGSEKIKFKNVSNSFTGIFTKQSTTGENAWQIKTTGTTSQSITTINFNFGIGIKI
jgi:hypothetical protein